MTKRLAVLLSILAISAVALAAQVSATDYIKMYGLYNRSDGIYMRVDSHGPDILINGYSRGSLGRKTFYEDFTAHGDGNLTCVQNDWTTCSGVAGEVNMLFMPSGNIIMNDSIVAQTAGVDMDAGSLDISGDQTDNDGLELSLGYGVGAENQFVPYIIGSDPAFFTCARFAIADVSGTDDMLVGFRRWEAHSGTVDNYNDMAALNVISGDIYIETIDDNGSTTSTDTTKNWADAATHTLCVYVSAAGVVTYKIDGNAPPTTAAFTWDDADPVIPFIHVLQASDLSGEIDLYEWEVGYQ